MMAAGARRVRGLNNNGHSNGNSTLDAHLELDQWTGEIDVRVLDVLAQIESLLRSAREIQRQILKVRGVPEPKTKTQRRAAAKVLNKTARAMLDESLALSQILRDLQRASGTLKLGARSRRRTGGRSAELVALDLAASRR